MGNHPALPAPREKAELTLRQVEGPTPNPPELLGEIADRIHALFPAVEDHARWTLIRGRKKDEAEIARIKADVVEKVGRLDLEFRRLVVERDAAETKAENEHREKMEELKIRRFQAKAEAAQKIMDAYASALARGVVFDARVTKLMAAKLIESLDVER